MIIENEKKLADKLILIRRDLHMIPETEFEEYKTVGYIKDELNKLGIEYENILDTGIAAIIKGKKGEGKTVLLRTDIDALPIDEKNNVPYRSTHKGRMHACGHDAHIACLLGAAKILSENRDDFFGCVKLIFQPAEEGTGGAALMIEKGIMSDPGVDVCLALHVEPLLNCGEIGWRNGAIMASPDDFSIKIIGKGGHGAYPEKCINPIYAASDIVDKLKKIVENNFDDQKKCVISVCSVNGGTSRNIIPDAVEITGTARSLDEDTRTLAEKLIYETSKEVCKKNKCRFEFEFNKLYPPLINDSSVNEILIKSVKSIDEKIKIKEQKEPSMTGDDFSYFACLVPSCYFKLGTGNENIHEVLHSSTFDIDERSLIIGAKILAKTSLDILSGEQI